MKFKVSSEEVIVAHCRIATEGEGIVHRLFSSTNLFRPDFVILNQFFGLFRHKHQDALVLITPIRVIVVLIVVGQVYDGLTHRCRVIVKTHRVDRKSRLAGQEAKPVAEGGTITELGLSRRHVATVDEQADGGGMAGKGERHHHLCLANVALCQVEHIRRLGKDALHLGRGALRQNQWLVVLLAQRGYGVGVFRAQRADDGLVLRVGFHSAYKLSQALHFVLVIPLQVQGDDFVKKYFILLPYLKVFECPVGYIFPPALL